MVKDETDKEMHEIYFASFDHMLTMEGFENYYFKCGRLHRSVLEGL